MTKEPRVRVGLKIGSVVIDCKDFERMSAFWEKALHYAPRRPPDGGFVVLKVLRVAALIFH